ncbi:MAG: hypothetical protein SOU03_00010 [Dorea sp.]|nr:hypothetical protein [Dorea sp.]
MADMTLEEALAAADVSTTPVNDILMIDPESRTIIVPASEMLFGVRQDMDAERKHFKCPKIVGDNIDLSQCHIYISYVPSKQDGTYDINDDVGGYWCEDLAVDGDYITFSWKLSGNVFVKAGYIAFAVYAKQEDADGNMQTKWHTTFAIGKVLDTLPDGEQIVEKYADVIEQLLNKMENVEKVATPEAMQGYVDDYLGRNPVQIDESLTDNTKAAPAGMVGELKGDLEQFKNDLNSFNDAEAKINIFNLAQTVEEVFKNTVFKSANTQAFDSLANLVDQLKPEGVVSVTYHLTNCTINNNSLYVMIGNSYSATVIPDSNTEFQGITVLMGGTDITDTSVSDKTISIENITGDIVITAISKSNEVAPGYAALSYVYSADTGDAYIDTEWTMTDLGEKMELGVQLPETNANENNTVAFFGVNADSAFSSVYSAIEIATTKKELNKIVIGWNNYQPNSRFEARYQGIFTDKAYYISLTNGSQQLFEDENMTTLYTGQFAKNSLTNMFDEEGTRIPPFTIWLFRSNYQDAAYNSGTKKTWRNPGVKIFCFKVWDKDGVLRVDMRPAKRESDNTIGFYDVVREKFFSNNCETGSLKGV